MSATEPDDRAEPRRRWMTGWIVAVALIPIMVAALAIYVLRRDIGARLAGNYLRAHGVESGIAIDQLSLHGFSGRLRLGPANDPDISADRVDVDLTIAPLWSSTPFQVIAHRIHLVRPRLKVTLKDGKVSLGGLNRLIGPTRPGSAPPNLPDILIDDGAARIVSAVGVLVVHGGGEIKGGRPVRLDLRSDAAGFAFARWSGHAEPGSLTLRAAGAALTADLSLPFSKLEGMDGVLTDSRLALHFTGLTSRSGALSGRGRLTGRLDVQAASRGAASARSLIGAVDVNLSQFALASGRSALAGDGQVKLSAAALGRDGSSLRAATVTLHLPRFEAAIDQDRWTGAATVDGVVKAADGEVVLAGGNGRLSALTATAKGQLNLSALGLTGALAATATARGGLSASDAARMAHAASGVADAYEAPLAAALKSVHADAPRITIKLSPGAARVGLGAPMMLAAASGAKLRLGPLGGDLFVFAKGRASGEGVLDLDGGGLPSIEIRVPRYTFAGGALDARVGLKSTLDLGPAKQARINAAGRAQFGAGQVRFDPDGCADIVAERLDLGATPIEAPNARICAAPGAPLIEASSAGWRSRGRLADAGAASDLYKVRVDQIGADFDAHGGGARATTARLHLTRANLKDTGAPVRFEPVSASGDLGLERGLWRGKLAVTTLMGQAIGTVDIRHQEANGEGEAVLDAPAIHFARGGLQPGDLSPLADPLRSAQGDARLKGLIRWSQGGLASSGEIVTAGLDFASPLGAVTRMETDIHLTSLLPPVTAPGQVVTARKVDAVIPLDSIRLVFSLDAARLSLESGHIGAAGGVIGFEPVQFPFAPSGVARGAIVLTGIDLGKVVAASTLADKVKLDIVVDGRLPYTFGADGFKLLKGALVAVRPGRLSIQRDVFVGAVQPNAIQDFAYQALANLAFDSLDATVESRSGGRLGVIFHVKGSHDPAVGQEAYVGLRQLADGSAFQKPIPLPKGTPIDLTLDTSLNFDQLLGDYRNALTQSHGPERASSSSRAVQR